MNNTIDRKEFYYKYLLYQAIENHNLDVLNIIPQRYIPKIHMDNLHLEIYCKQNDFFNIKYILSCTKNPNIINTLFELSVIYENIDIIKYLLNHGADIHYNYESALMYACEKGNIDIIDCLINHGIDVHVNDDYALILAVENMNIQTVKYLIDKGADIHVNDDYALRFSCENGYIELTKILVEHGADIHALQDHSIRWASINGHLDIVQYLVEKENNSDCYKNKSRNSLNRKKLYRFK